MSISKAKGLSYRKSVHGSTFTWAQIKLRTRARVPRYRAAIWSREQLGRVGVMRRGTPCKNRPLAATPPEPHHVVSGSVPDYFVGPIDVLLSPC